MKKAMPSALKSRYVMKILKQHWPRRIELYHQVIFGSAKGWGRMRGHWELQCHWSDQGDRCLWRWHSHQGLSWIGWSQRREIDHRRRPKLWGGGAGTEGRMYVSLPLQVCTVWLANWKPANQQEEQAVSVRWATNVYIRFNMQRLYILWIFNTCHHLV